MITLTTKRSIRFAFMLLALTTLVNACTPSTSAVNYPPAFQGNVSTVYGSGIPIKLKASPCVESEFTWKDSSGTMHSLSELKGKVVVLNFWGITCQPCLDEMPDFQTVSKERAIDDVVVIGVSIDEGDNVFNTIHNFIQAEHVTYLNIVDPLQSIYKNYSQQNAIPQTFLIDRNGIVQRYFAGLQKRQQLNDAIDQIL
ncbi:MAG: TlpA disulfide reductase family protein [Candidatus Kapaibacterium sp.]|jgi:peroxiredoxin